MSLLLCWRVCLSPCRPPVRFLVTSFSSSSSSSLSICLNGPTGDTWSFLKSFHFVFNSSFFPTCLNKKRMKATRRQDKQNVEDKQSKGRLLSLNTCHTQRWGINDAHTYSNPHTGHCEQGSCTEMYTWLNLPDVPMCSEEEGRDEQFLVNFSLKPRH